MPLADLFLLLLFPPLLAASACFSGSETSLFSLTHAERMQIRARGGVSARAVASLLHDPRALIITILVGNMTVNTMAFVIASVLTLRAQGALLQAAISLSGLLAVILVGEVLPKLLASTARVRFARALAPPLLTLHRALAPLRRPLAALVVAPIGRLVAGGPRASTLDPDEVESLLRQSARGGVLEETEAGLLEAVADLSRLRVYDIMTPRVDVEWLDAGAAVADLAALAARAPAPIVPVCEGSLDSGVVGVLDAAETLARAGDAPRAPIRRFMRRPHFVPETARLDQLLETLRRLSPRFAVVVDEFGGVVGTVAFSDLARRLVAGLARHTAPPWQAAGLERIDARTWRVPGRLSVVDWADLFGPSRERDTGAATVAGLVLARLGRAAAPGDEVADGPLRLRVERVEAGVIESVVVSLAGGAPPPGAPRPEGPR